MPDLWPVLEPEVVVSTHPRSCVIPLSPSSLSHLTWATVTLKLSSEEEHLQS